MPRTYEQPRIRFTDEKLAELRAAIHEIRRIQNELAGLDATWGSPLYDAFRLIDEHLCAQHNDHA